MKKNKKSNKIKASTIEESSFFDSSASVKQVLDSVISALVEIRKDLDVPCKKLEKVWNTTSKEQVRALKILDNRMRKKTKPPKNLWSKPAVVDCGITGPNYGPGSGPDSGKPQPQPFNGD